MAKTETEGSTPGEHDVAMAATSNPTTEQVTQQGGKAVPAEGQRLREQARKDDAKRDVVTLADAVTPDNVNLKYDETGALTNSDGKKVALAADALDSDVGWTVQSAGAHQKDGDKIAYPGGYATTPDQTVHPDELPDPVAALRAGLLPQNTEVLNIDPKKFEGKKSLEP